MQNNSALFLSKILIIFSLTDLLVKTDFYQYQDEVYMDVL